MKYTVSKQLHWRETKRTQRQAYTANSDVYASLYRQALGNISPRASSAAAFTALRRAWTS